MTFTDDEFAFLRSHGIARPVTSGEDDLPDVVPVAVEFDGVHFWIAQAGSGSTAWPTVP